MIFELVQVFDWFGILWVGGWIRVFWGIWLFPVIGKKNRKKLSVLGQSMFGYLGIKVKKGPKLELGKRDFPDL